MNLPSLFLLFSFLVGRGTTALAAPLDRDPFAAPRMPNKPERRAASVSLVSRTEQLLEEARKLRKKKQWRLALVTLREFVSTFPDHIYADRVHFWIAESHYELAEYKLASATSEFLSQTYPHSVVSNEARLLGTLSRVMAGETSAASELRGLLEKAPESRFARAAEEKLLVGSTGVNP